MTNNQFKKARKALQFSQDDLAAELGMSKRIIQYYESGEQPVTKCVELAVKYLLLLAKK